MESETETETETGAEAEVRLRQSPLMAMDANMAANPQPAFKMLRTRCR